MKYAEIVRNLLEKKGAIWTYQGEPRPDRPHALLTSGVHSDGYVNVGQFLKESPHYGIEIAYYIMETLQEHYDGPVTAVVGADTSSTELAGRVAKLLGAKHIRMIKSEIAGEKCQIWNPDNPELSKDSEVILHIEDLLTTASSAQQVRRGLRQAYPGKVLRFVPYLLVVVERSNPDARVSKFMESDVLHLLQLNIRNYDPTVHCPYCAAGSEAIKPKLDNNWLRLNGKD